MNEINAVIIDDELFNRELIKDFVLKLNAHYNIVGETDNIRDAYELINKLKPDLLFLDVKMPGGSGFELLEKFETYDFEVVFVTGFDEYAIKAFEFNALDYVLKPIDRSKFNHTLTKVKTRLDNKLLHVSNLKSVIQSYNPKNALITKIPVHYKDQVVLLDINEIMYLKSEDGYTAFFTSNSEKYISSKKLSAFEFILNDFIHFTHINKGIYINLNFVKSYTKGGICFITLMNNTILEVSRRKKTEILEILMRK